MLFEYRIRFLRFQVIQDLENLKNLKKLNFLTYIFTTSATCCFLPACGVFKKKNSMPIFAKTTLAQR